MELPDQPPRKKLRPDDKADDNKDSFNEVNGSSLNSPSISAMNSNTVFKNSNSEKSFNKSFTLKIQGSNGIHSSNGMSNTKMENNNANGNNSASNAKNENGACFINRFQFEKLQHQRKSLPIYHGSETLMKYIGNHDTIILAGETGSGKTTQVPQFLYEDRLLLKGGCVVTQPRRIAATTIATRVAQEMRTQLGQLVGYSVRFDDMTSDKTKIKFATDGMLLREAMLDPCLKRYSYVILDEAHERTVNTDILFGVVKAAQKVRKEKDTRPLHIIVMSATMNYQKFVDYFNGCPILNAPGREHKLDLYFLDTTCKLIDYVPQCLCLAMKVHRDYPVNQGILVFLTGQEEIDQACDALRIIMKRVDPSRFPPMKVSPLYAALPQHLQIEAFAPTPQGVRHVIVATNIAETSVTIPGIRHVVESGHVKVRTFSPSSGFETLKVRRICQAQAWQRAGRAGREADGICHFAYTDQQFDKMMHFPIPEIHRAHLGAVVLQLLSVGVTDIYNFDFVDKPREASFRCAVDQLVLLEAVEKKENGQIHLTELGKKMAVFPLEPKYSKIIIMGPQYKCTEEVRLIKLQIFM